VKTVVFEGCIRFESDKGRRFELVGEGEILEARFDNLRDAIAVGRTARNAHPHAPRLAGLVPIRVRIGPRLVIELGRTSDTRAGAFSRAGVASRLLGLPISAVRRDPARPGTPDAGGV
jgi:hypothetical protein